MTFNASRVGRQTVRFSVVGEVWASLGFSPEDALLRNVSSRGALIETTLPPPFKSIRIIDVQIWKDKPSLSGIVRHITPVADHTEPHRYVIGVEFPWQSALTSVDWEQFVSAQQA